MRKLAQLPVRIGGAQPLLDVEERGQFPGIGRRRGIEFLGVDGDPDAVPVLQLKPAGGGGAGERLEGVGPGRRADLVQVAHIPPLRPGAVVLVERGQGRKPVLAGRRTPQRGRRSACREGEKPAWRDVRRQLGDDRLAGLQVHKHPEQQHRVVRLAAGHRGQAVGRPGPHRDAIPHLGPLGVQRGAEGGPHVRVGLDREHLITRAGQPDELRPLAGPDVENPRRRRSQVPGQLTRDHLLPDDVAHLVQPAQPDRTAITERAVSSDLAAARHLSSGHPDDVTR